MTFVWIWGTERHTAILCRINFAASKMGHPTKNIVTPEGKILRPCSHCQALKPLVEFSPRTAGGHIAACRSCMGGYQSKRYYRDVEKSRKTARESAIKIRTPKQVFVNAIKAATPCTDCGRFFPAVCMDFDHLPGSDKVADVAQMANGTQYSLAAIEREIAKCEIVCANCHRIRTSKRPKHRKSK